MRDLLGFIVGGGAGLLVGILIGAAIFGAYGFFSNGGTNIPYAQDHVKIAEGFRVRDTTWNTEFELKHLMTGPMEFSAGAPQSIYFPKHLQTTQSLWMWGIGGDAEAFMVITGPGNDSKSYLIGFSRMMDNGASITGWGQTITWQQGAASGWTVVEVKLS